MTQFLVFLLFIAPTIQYRIELGRFSFALMEPIVLLVSAILLAHQIVSRRRLAILKDPLIFLFGGLTLWAFAIRPWAPDWQHGLSDMRDWAIPVLGFAALSSTVRRGWRRWITLFLVLVFLSALLGIYQHTGDTFRPFITELAAKKRGFTVSPGDERLALVSFAVGFFSHPNAFAMYLFVGVMIALGKWAEDRKRWWKAVLLFPVFLALFWTYAKTSFLVMSFVIAFFWLQRHVRSGRNLLILVGTVVLLGALAILSVAQYIPAAYLNTFWWRVGLWETALDVISEHPAVLFVGNGMDIFADRAYYVQPHHLYLYMLLEYGLPGLALALMILWNIWQRGWRAWRARLMQREPVLAALWVALLGYFVIGLAESNLRGIESRMIFLLAAACFVGLTRETRTMTSTPANTRDTTYARKAIADPDFI